MKLKSLLAALPILVTGISVSQVASADDWGCEVLLCLSDPRGPTTESECRPPIEKLWEHLAKGRSFPTCSLAGNASSGSGSFAKQIRDAYDPCPDGLIPTGGYIAQSDSTNPRDWRRLQYAASSMGKNVGFFNGNLGPRACVGNKLGNYTVGYSDERVTVSVFDNVVWQQPQNPRAIDVYIDGKLHKRVRY